MDEKLLVHLQPPRPMLLIPWPSGVVFEVQTNGMLCFQMQTEGICLPLGPGEWLEPHLFELHPGCCALHGDLDPELFSGEEGLEEQEATALDTLFQECHLSLAVNRLRRKESCEAWVHVQITTNNDLMLQAFSGRDGILIWQNCD